MSPHHTEIVRKEPERMVAAGIITPVESSWPSPVIIATIKEWVSTILCRLSKIERSYACRSLTCTPCKRNTRRYARELGIHND